MTAAYAATDHDLDVDDGDRALNLVQTVTLTLVLGLGAGIATWMAGGGLVPALLAAWFGGSLGILGLSWALCAFEDRLGRRAGHGPAIADPSAYVDADLAEHIAAWDADLAEERATAAARTPMADDAPIPQRRAG